MRDADSNFLWSRQIFFRREVDENIGNGLWIVLLGILDPLGDVWRKKWRDAPHTAAKQREYVEKESRAEKKKRKN